MMRSYKYIFEKDRKNHDSYQWLIGRFPKVKKFTLEEQEKLPTQVDFRDILNDKYPEVYDQGKLGSCTANATVGAMQIDQGKESIAENMLSRLFLYYEERHLDGTIEEDAGSTLANALKIICSDGVCRESIWAYDDGPIKFKQKPFPDCYKDALNHVDLDNLDLAIVGQDVNSIKTALAKINPIVLGIKVYESFESRDTAETGIVPMPDSARERLLGGHAIAIIGYDDEKTWTGGRGMFLCRNSWGSQWGERGHFWAPYQYLTDPDLAGDLWQISKIGRKQ